MIYQIEFRTKKRNLPLPIQSWWTTHTQIVQADTIDEAREQLQEQWNKDHSVEIITTKQIPQ